MGKDQPDGCKRDCTVHHKLTRPIVEPTNSGCKELDNEMKLGTNFMETASTNVLANCDIPLQEQNSLGNLETSDDMSDTRSRKTLDNDFHSYENESCVDDYYDDCFAFEKIEYKVPTPKINISEQQLVATTIMVVDTIHNHESTKLLPSCLTLEDPVR